MTCYVLSEAAQNDIMSIQNYTLDTWGRVQTDKYLSKLEQRLEWLVKNQQVGKKRDDVKCGYMSFPEGRHIIFYRISEHGIEVIGIVHQSEDIDVHFSS